MICRPELPIPKLDTRKYSGQKQCLLDSVPSSNNPSLISMTDDSVDQTEKPDTSLLNTPTEHHQQQQKEDEDLHRFLVPDVRDLPLTPSSAVESNFVSYFAPGSSLFSQTIAKQEYIHVKFNYVTSLLLKFTDLMKPGHDQYVYRHANGYILDFTDLLLCV